MRSSYFQQTAITLVIIAIACLAGFTDECYAYSPREGNVTANVGPFYSKTNIEGAGAKYNPFRTGFGVVAVGDVNNSGSLEVGIFNMRKVFFVERDNAINIEKIEVVHITMGYRFWLNSIFSTSLAFNSSYTIGKPAVIYNDFPPSSDVKSSAEDLTEYGFDFAGQAQLWERDNLGIFIDLRYSASVTNKEDETGDHFGIFVGARWLVQGASAAKP